MSAPQLYAAIVDKSNTNSNESICRSLTPRKVALVNRNEIHEKVRRPFIMDHYLDLTHIDMHSTSVITSLLSFHNETLNIYTHLIPGALILIYLISEWHKLGTFLWIDWNDMCFEPNLNDLYGLFVFDDVIYSQWHSRSVILHTLILSLFIMCCLSSYYHCGRCCDPYLHDFYLSIDWSGVMLLIFCSFLSCIYVAFECYPIVQKIYFGLVFGFIFFVLTPMFFIWPIMTSFKCKAVALAAFGGFGAIVIPIHWLCFLATDDEYNIFSIVSIKFFIIYGIGFVCFIKRFPERINPGLFDKIGNSHNIWHCCIVIGSWIWWKGLVQVAENRIHC